MVINNELKLLYFKNLFSEYRIKKLSEEDVTDIYNLCKENSNYYSHINTEAYQRRFDYLIIGERY